MAKRTEPGALVASLAAAMVERHDQHISEGYRLTGASRIWERRDGDCTGRFVYRNRAGLQTIAYTARWTGERPKLAGGGMTSSDQIELEELIAAASA